MKCMNTTWLKWLVVKSRLCNTKRLNEKQSWTSRISQSLEGPLLGMRQAGSHFVPSNGPTSDCEMRLTPDCFSLARVVLRQSDAKCLWMPVNCQGNLTKCWW